LGVDSAGRLTIGGADVCALASEYGTPLYVMDEDKLRRNCRAFMSTMGEHYPGEWAVAYASKAFACARMYSIAHSEGLLTDVASGGELYTALKGGMPPSGIIFHGNNKTDEELRYALETKIHRIVANSGDELRRISLIAGEMGITAGVSLRLSPGVTDGTIHTAVQTGLLDSKFGVPVAAGEAMNAVRLAAVLDNIVLEGIHCHIGSPIFDIEPYLSAVRTMTAFMAEADVPLGELNVGGGFAVRYLEGQEVLPIGDYIRMICGEVAENARLHGLELPRLVVEPGRAVAADAGITIYTVGSVKNVPGVRTYVSVDGGMTDNPRYMLYGAEYDILSPDRALESKTETVTLAGRCCECEVLGVDLKVQPVKPGDLIAVLCTGAYNYAMASNYNRIPRPPVVMVSGGKASVAVRRETWEDVAGLDIL
jgi:diaminopimelate decarboxylase